MFLSFVFLLLPLLRLRYCYWLCPLVFVSFLFPPSISLSYTRLISSSTQIYFNPQTRYTKVISMLLACLLAIRSTRYLNFILMFVPSINFYNPFINLIKTKHNTIVSLSTPSSSLTFSVPSPFYGAAFLSSNFNSFSRDSLAPDWGSIWGASRNCFDSAINGNKFRSLTCCGSFCRTLGRRSMASLCQQPFGARCRCDSSGWLFAWSSWDSRRWCIERSAHWCVVAGAGATIVDWTVSCTIGIRFWALNRDRAAIGEVVREREIRHVNRIWNDSKSKT